MIDRSTLLEKWEAMQTAKAAFVEALQSFTVEQEALRPSEGWSARQVLEHVLASETGTLGYMLKKTSSGWDALEDVADEHRNNGQALVNRLASDERYKAPDVLPQPPNELSIEDGIKRWNEVRVKFEAFVMSIDPRYYSKQVFRQPYAGMLDVPHTLDFVTHHVQHHIPQLHRIRQAQGW